MTAATGICTACLFMCLSDITIIFCNQAERARAEGHLLHANEELHLNLQRKDQQIHQKEAEIQQSRSQLRQKDVELHQKDIELNNSQQHLEVALHS